MQSSILKVVLPGQVVSKKNGRFKQFSPQYKSWRAKAMWGLKSERPVWEGNYPAFAFFTFFMEDERLRDLSNMLEGPQDVMVKMNVIKDDDWKHIRPICISVLIDKANPRVQVEFCNANDLKNLDLLWHKHSRFYGAKL